MSIERWSVWLANLDPVIGSEQGKTRPVLIISRSELNEILPVINIIPITSRKPGRRIYPNEVLLPAHSANLSAESIALCFQIRTVDKRRLSKKIGTLSESVFRKEIIAALSYQLEISELGQG